MWELKPPLNKINLWLIIPRFYDVITMSQICFNNNYYKHFRKGSYNYTQILEVMIGVTPHNYLPVGNKRV